MNLLDSLAPHAGGELSGREALVTGTGRKRQAVSFAALDARVAAVAEALRAHGLRPGNRLLLLHPVSIPLYTVLLGAWRAGLVTVLPHPGGGVRGLRQLVLATAPDAVFLPPWLDPLRWAVPELRHIPRPLRPLELPACDPRLVEDEPPCSGDPLDLDPAHPALLSPTSGSTGRAKIVVRSHAVLAAQLAAVAATAGYRPGERELVTMPALALAAIASGVTAVLADCPLSRPDRARADRLVAQLQAEGVERAIAAPAFFETLLRQVEALPLRLAITGGGPIHAPLMQQFHQIHQIHEGHEGHEDHQAPADPESTSLRAVYGSTEAEPIAALDLDAAATAAEGERIAAGHGLPLGRPLPGLELAILRTDPQTPLDPDRWEELRCAPDEVGELLVSGPQVVPGYLDPADEALTKVDLGDHRWHHTGDAVSREADGSLRLHGRVSQRLPEVADSPDACPWPLAIEAALRARHPEIRAAVLAHRGQRVLAIEATRRPPGLGLADLPSWMGIEEIAPLRRLPMDRRHRSKIDLPRLRRMLG